MPIENNEIKLEELLPSNEVENKIKETEIVVEENNIVETPQKNVEEKPKAKRTAKKRSTKKIAENPIVQEAEENKPQIEQQPQTEEKPVVVEIQNVEKETSTKTKKPRKPRKTKKEQAQTQVQSQLVEG